MPQITDYELRPDSSIDGSEEYVVDLSGVTYKVNSMQNINYKNKFDALICIFSIIVFNKSNINNISVQYK